MSPAIWRLVGFLAAVEIASGVLQGYYTPIYSDIADHLRIADGDVNWFEAVQLIVSALAVPVLSHRMRFRRASRGAGASSFEESARIVREILGQVPVTL